MTDLRIKAREEANPKTVQLPNGTEVETSADRTLPDGRLITAGAVGRVVGTTSDGQFDVKLVGVGVVRYAREELLARKVGQVRYAKRREAAWEALHPCRVIEATVGSRAWGLSDEGSDTDLRGVFCLPLSWNMGLASAPSDLVSADGSASYWEISKAIRQALRADPNTLESLYVPTARPLDEMGEWLLQERDAFVSVELHGSFGRYALSQLTTLGQALRMAEHRSIVLEWLRSDPTLTLDAVAVKLAEQDLRTYPTRAHAEQRAKEYLKQLYRSLFDQGLLTAAKFEAMVDFARSKEGAFELPRDLRPKNAYNLLRLLMTAIGWLETGTPQFALQGAFREQLFAIKKGGIPLGAVLTAAEELTPRLEEARVKSALPKRADLQRADAVLRRVSTELAKRFVLAAPGPFGRDAPAPPEVRWDNDDE